MQRSMRGYCCLSSAHSLRMRLEHHKGRLGDGGARARKVLLESRTPGLKVTAKGYMLQAVTTLGNVHSATARGGPAPLLSKLRTRVCVVCVHVYRTPITAKFLKSLQPPVVERRQRKAREREQRESKRESERESEQESESKSGEIGSDRRATSLRAFSPLGVGEGSHVPRGVLGVGS